MLQSTSIPAARKYEHLPRPSYPSSTEQPVFGGNSTTGRTDYRASAIKPIGLGLDFLDTSFTQHRSSTIYPPTNKLRTLQTYPSAQEHPSTRMDVCTDSNTPQTHALLLISPTLAIDSPDFNSLRDLDIQYSSSRNLNFDSPSVFSPHYSYSPPVFSPSWSLDSIFSAPFSSPQSRSLTPPDSPAVSASSSSTFGFVPWGSVTLATMKEPPTELSPDIVMPLADANMSIVPSCIEDVNDAVNPAYLILNFAEPCSLGGDSFVKEQDFCDSDFFHYNSDGFIRPPFYASTVECVPSLPSMLIDDEEHSSEYVLTAVLPSPPTFQNAIATVSVNLKRKTTSSDTVPSKKQKKNHLPTSARQVIFGTPILNAHHGITQEELKAKAARYQQRNPGAEDFDKDWLAAFTGKLTGTGATMQDFRCYIVGCTQVNKRRDHMIVHLGSHLDLRRFECTQCLRRYRRNNELRRHKRTHEDAQPFICSLCPGSAAFKRLDVLNRHLKTKHGVTKENDDPRRTYNVSSN
ncbi:hypothetical protein R3P38DRAFT_2595987 [Favolaschia claudopus]|uniref:C2H2-type domain-containing protein n=1 Tax=Favolaschia claudopus TaxID=2862362 RepID=A0AAW0EAT9_9AGAR